MHIYNIIPLFIREESFFEDSYLLLYLLFKFCVSLENKGTKI